jgi:hypothetical protein
MKLVLLVLACGLVAACGDDSPTAPSRLRDPHVACVGPQPPAACAPYLGRH